MSRRRKKREGQVENLAFCYLLSVSDIGELQPSGSDSIVVGCSVSTVLLHLQP